MVVEETPGKGIVRHIKTKEISDLTKGEVLIKVHYSSLKRIGDLTYVRL